MNTVVYHFKTEEEAKQWGQSLGEQIDNNICFLLIGDLGAGKTTISKAIAKGLGVIEEVTSPTFSIMNVYTSGRLPLYHFDLYRLETISELENIGFHEYVTLGVSIVEWADKFIDEMPRKTIACYIDINNDGSRTIRLVSRKYSVEDLEALGGNNVFKY